MSTKLAYPNWQRESAKNRHSVGSNPIASTAQWRNWKTQRTQDAIFTGSSPACAINIVREEERKTMMQEMARRKRKRMIK